MAEQDDRLNGIAARRRMGVLEEIDRVLRAPRGWQELRSAQGRVLQLVELEVAETARTEPPPPAVQHNSLRRRAIRSEGGTFESYWAEARMDGTASELLVSYQRLEAGRLHLTVVPPPGVSTPTLLELEVDGVRRVAELAEALPGGRGWLLKVPL